MNLYYNDFFGEFKNPTQLWGEGELSDFKLTGRWKEKAFSERLEHKMDGNSRVISVSNHNFSLPSANVNNQSFDFTISAFHNNCGLCIISGVGWSGGEFTAKLALEYAVYLCEQMGYSEALYSVYTEQAQVIKALESIGFVEQKGTLLENKRSGNEIVIYAKKLNPNFNQEDDWNDDESDF